MVRAKSYGWMINEEKWHPRIVRNVLFKGGCWQITGLLGFSVRYCIERGKGEEIRIKKGRQTAMRIPRRRYQCNVPESFRWPKNGQIRGGAVSQCIVQSLGNTITLFCHAVSAIPAAPFEAVFPNNVGPNTMAKLDIDIWLSASCFVILFSTQSRHFHKLAFRFSATPRTCANDLGSI